VTEREVYKCRSGWWAPRQGRAPQRPSMRGAAAAASVCREVGVQGQDAVVLQALGKV
jgi:hypothetical protein